MKDCQEPSPSLAPPFQLASERLGPLPLVNELIEQLHLQALLERYVPTSDRRCRLPYDRDRGSWGQPLTINIVGTGGTG
jgi:hypothetical protein